MMRNRIFYLILFVMTSFGVIADDTDLFTHESDQTSCDIPGRASPAISTSLLNPFEHQKSIYYPVFQSSARSYWYGNVKRYELNVTKSGERNVLSYPGGGQSKYAIVSCQDLAEKSKQCFSHGSVNSQRARSWWNDNPEADGALVTEGGAAVHIGGKGSRNVYVQMSATSLMRGAGHNTDQYFLEKNYGAPLHSKPLVVDYGDKDGGVRQVLFASTNGGFVHLVDSETGAELSAIFPKSLMHNISAYKNKEVGALVYGMDGQWTIWRHDGNADGRIDKYNNEDFVYLYGGMRRGGRNFYGFDVTDPERPQILFDISPNTGSKFSHLGQIWAKPTLAWVRIPNYSEPVAVLLVGGGYDSNHDPGDDLVGEVAIDTGNETGDDINMHSCSNMKVQCGNQIFMLLAQKKAGDYRAGDIVWWSSQSANSNLVNPDMQDSVVGRVRTLDEDGDGYFDHFYAVDISGKVFAYSFSQVPSKEKHKRDVRNLYVSLLATLNAPNDSFNSLGAAGDKRFFYESPSLSTGRDHLGYYRLMTIGSGWRANPLSEKTNDAFFVIKDRPNRTRISPLLNDDFPEFGSHFFADKIALNGFQVALSKAGEKVMGSSSVINNRVFFSTYKPEAVNDPAPFDGCNQHQGDVALYGIDISSGLGVFDSHGGIVGAMVDGAHVLHGLGLSSLGDINSVMTGKSMSLLSGTEFVGELDVPTNMVHRLSWHEAARGESVFQLFPHKGKGD
ncbi:hypothetical protein A9Q81_25935 [Gammaproteobacteria bacterium 42_54_T18]|nr:hypothetical protein A9Q81_25935 [Gammaproteobacteria bacterium 42_54_T18]